MLYIAVGVQVFGNVMASRVSGTAEVVMSWYQTMRCEFGE